MCQHETAGMSASYGRRTFRRVLQMTNVPEFLTRVLSELPESMLRDHVLHPLTLTPQRSTFGMNRR